ncbi:MAG: hypothetical protein WBE76_18080 [Terracidiphilus sp.]
MATVASSSGAVPADAKLGEAGKGNTLPLREAKKGNQYDFAFAMFA